MSHEILEECGVQKNIMTMHLEQTTRHQRRLTEKKIKVQMLSIGNLFSTKREVLTREAVKKV